MSETTPSVTIWNRLEARPRSVNFSRSLRAEVRDALWFLTRQWQFGEFRGEDTGTAVHTRVDMETTRMGKMSLRGKHAVPFNTEIPLETQVERVEVRFDVPMRMEMGRHWKKILRREMIVQNGSVDEQILGAIYLDYLSNPDFWFTMPSPGFTGAEFYSQPDLWQMYAPIVDGKAIDGEKLYLRFATTNVSAASFLSPGNLGNSALVNAAQPKFLDWFKKSYHQPSAVGDTAWHSSHLEYQFACSAPLNGTQHTLLSADEYYSGSLDWYNFDFETDFGKCHTSLTNGVPDTGLIDRKTFTVIPKKVSFPGMPVARWWEFEDGKVDFGKLNPSKTDLASMLFAEFALIYLNDWMVIPFGVQVGSLCGIKSIIVKDSFGQYTRIKAAGASDNADWRRWNMFNLKTRGRNSTSADMRLFVPPVSLQVLESPPLESVNFMRDEMANVVWAIETLVPDGMGNGTRGVEASTRLREYLKSLPSTIVAGAPPVPNDAKIKYQLSTASSVPENWIPLIPVRLGNTLTSRSIQLRRASIPRILDNLPPQAIRPRTDLLREGLDQFPVAPLYIFEEAIPRSGAIVHSTWQRTRWTDGKIATWMGRKKATGRGEGNMGLRFDQILPK